MHLLIDMISKDCLRESITGVINGGSAAPKILQERNG